MKGCEDQVPDGRRRHPLHLRKGHWQPAEAGREPHDRALRDLIGELSTLSRDFRTLWAATTSVSATAASNSCAPRDRRPGVDLPVPGPAHVPACGPRPDPLHRRTGQHLRRPAQAHKPGGDPVPDARAHRPHRLTNCLRTLRATRGARALRPHGMLHRVGTPLDIIRSDRAASCSTLSASTRGMGRSSAMPLAGSRAALSNSHVR